jgi:superfamily II DNA or RNA helicase
VALIQSLVRKGVVDDQVGQYGHLVIDECHHLSAHSFEQVARRFKGKFVTGLSATVTRKDGHHPIIFMQCGPIRHRVDAKEQAAVRPFEHTVFVGPTGFRHQGTMNPDVRMQFHALYDQLIRDEARSRLIVAEVIQSVRNGRSPVVLTERNEHLDRLAECLTGEIRHVLVLRGAWAERNSSRSPRNWPAFQKLMSGSYWQPADISGKDSTIPGSTHCFLLCPYRGAAQSRNTSAGCIG